MTSGLKVHTSLSQTALAPNTYLEEPLYIVMDLEPIPLTNAPAGHVPLNLVILVDASATMHHFQLSDEEQEYWMGMAISRDEMERGEADAREAVYWTGQTLTEMQSVARTAMALVVEGIKELLARLDPSDRVSVIAFADRVHTVFSPEDWVAFPDQCLVQMELLREQRLPVDIGTGTMMAEGLIQASDQLKNHAREDSVNRLIIISDGIVQDADASLASIETIQNEGYAITTIGVGDEFDEEFLMRVADNSRGDYRYAADIAEITECLNQEVTTLQHIAINDLYVAMRGLNGTVIQDIYQIRPAMSVFDEVYTEEEWTRARIGSVSSMNPTSILVQIAPSSLPPGEQSLGEALFTWINAGTNAGGGNERQIVAGHVAAMPEEVQSDPHVQDIVDRFTIYKYEREAQRAQERGDMDRAREKLGAATRELHKIGEDHLAGEIEQQMAALGTASADPTRVKRIKATTRRLISQSDALQETL